MLKLKKLFAKAAVAADQRCRNGRFIRNVVDRLKMKQGKRLLSIEKPNRNQLFMIKLADVETLLEDSDIRVSLENRQENTIGF